MRIDVTTAPAAVSQIGVDMSPCRAGSVPDCCGTSLRQVGLGAYFRCLCSCMDKPKAVTAAAHKLARLIYTMLTKG